MIRKNHLLNAYHLKKLSLYFFFIASATILLFLNNRCTIPQFIDRAPRLDPISVFASIPLLLEEVRIPIEEGTLIGRHHEEYLRIPKVLYNWFDNFFIDTSLFGSLLQRELEGAGYNVFEKDIFENMPPNLPENFYILTCTVIRITCNTYGPRAGSYSEGFIELDWRLSNKDRSEILFRKNTLGAARTGTQVGEWSVEEAFRFAVRNLLADKSFVRLV